jgi:putative Mg2+ transporter-C (MgtC) family protein
VNVSRGRCVEEERGAVIPSPAWGVGFTRASFGQISDRRSFSWRWRRRLRSRVPIGWDREKRARSAGLRTFPLVAMASCGFVQASEGLLVHSPDGMAKVIEGLITGIGFIGGGAILKQGTTVQGTATAASLWATGAIGVSVGLGSYDVAVTVAVFTFLTLRLLTLVKEEDDLKGGERKSDNQGRIEPRFDLYRDRSRKINRRKQSTHHA